MEFVCNEEFMKTLVKAVNTQELIDFLGTEFVIKDISTSVTFKDHYYIDLRLSQVYKQPEKELPEEFYFKTGSGYPDYLYKAVLKEGGERYQISWKEDEEGTGATYGVKYAKKYINDGTWQLVEVTPEQILAEERYTHYKAKMEAAKKDMEYWEGKL